jgi:hypothetical protein
MHAGEGIAAISNMFCVRIAEGTLHTSVAHAGGCTVLELHQTRCLGDSNRHGTHPWLPVSARRGAKGVLGLEMRTGVLSAATVGLVRPLRMKAI